MAIRSLGIRYPNRICEWLQGRHCVAAALARLELIRPDPRFCTPTMLRTSLMNSTIASKMPGVTALASALRFNIPMVVNGHVYVGTKHEVDVYGLLPVR